MAKKSKWFVVATEGATTDGREIQRNWIEEMAESYDPKNTYGARINLDHIKFTLLFDDVPNSHCFGDVLAVKTQEREDGKLQLLAEISPTESLVKLNQARQKVYTSVEIDTNFANTNKAYLVGLAVTDNPASLGTEMLAFSHNGLTERKLKAENIFTACIETHLEFEDIEEKQGLLDKIKALFNKSEKSGDERFADHEKSIELLAEKTAEMQEKFTALSTELTANLTAQKAELEQAQSELSEIKAKFAQLEQQPATDYSERPPVTGESHNANGYFF